MQNGRNVDLILLNGPSSAGKSTVAQELTARLSEMGTCRLIALDDYMTIGTDEEIWEDDVFEATNGMYADVARALKENALVIVDHVITSSRIYDGLARAVGGKRWMKVLVTCRLETLIRREKRRGDRFIGSAEASFRYLYPREGYDLTADSEKQSAAEIAAAIAEACGVRSGADGKGGSACTDWKPSD